MTNRNQGAAAKPTAHRAAKPSSGRSKGATVHQWSKRARANGEDAKPAPEKIETKAKADKAPSKRKQAQAKAEAEWAKTFKPGSIVAAAKKVKATPKARVLPKKDKVVNKRVDTDADTLKAAKKYLADLARKGELSKVGVVREMAAWNGEVLQRRDVHALVAEFPKLEIAPATVSTQFQLVRSGALAAK